MPTALGGGWRSSDRRGVGCDDYNAPRASPPPHNKHSVIPAQAGMTRKCGRFARRHIALDCHSRTPTFSTLIVLLCNDREYVRACGGGTTPSRKARHPSAEGNFSPRRYAAGTQSQRGALPCGWFCGGITLRNLRPGILFLPFRPGRFRRWCRVSKFSHRAGHNCDR